MKNIRKLLTIQEITQIIDGHSRERARILEDKQYYAGRNRIKRRGVNKVADKDPLRNADNRIAHNFHEIIVNEKAAYMLTYPVQFDAGSKRLNDDIRRVLGDDFECDAQRLCVEACNAGRAWLHCWMDAAGRLQYAPVDAEQVIPVYKDSLKRELRAVYRYYQEELENGGTAIYFEHWTDSEFTTYILDGSLEIPSHRFRAEPLTVQHKLGRVPFIEFRNNHMGTGDLVRYKGLIDLYDIVISGFANDLEDIQQIIYIIENYGGANLKEFLTDLKRYKAIKTNPQSGSGGVKTLQIEIPVEARKVLLDIVKKQIYESGQALQQDVESVGNASGVALKFFYRKLELKAGLTETEFRRGFGELVRVILRYLHEDDALPVKQTWTRNAISNDLETAQIAQMSAGIVSMKTIWENHPWVDNADEEEKRVQQETGERDEYQNIGGTAKEDADGQP